MDISLIFSILGFFIGGFLSSYLIAKYVINVDAKNTMEKLSSQVKNNEVEKKRFLKNLLWVIEDFGLFLPKAQHDFKTIEEWEAYNMGANHAIKARQTDILKRLSYGIEETNSMFEDDWTKNDK